MSALMLWSRHFQNSALDVATRSLLKHGFFDLRRYELRQLVKPLCGLRGSGAHWVLGHIGLRREQGRTSSKLTSSTPSKVIPTYDSLFELFFLYWFFSGFLVSPRAVVQRHVLSY